MAETKEQIAAQRDKLASENTILRAQLAAAGRPAGVTPAQHTFQLSQGDLSDLERNGWMWSGAQVMTVADVRAALRGTPQEDIKIVEPDNPQVPRPVEPTNIRGFDYTYPSVSRGLIDPALAGTPGINGPAADVKPAEPAEDVVE
jgi:hypothetical protein